MSEQLDNRNFAWVTLYNNKRYLPGLLYLIKNLNKYSKYPLYILCKDSLKYTLPEGCFIIPYSDSIDLQGDFSGEYSEYQYFKGADDKLKIFDLDRFDKIVYTDCDVQLLENVDELFDCQLYDSNDLYALSDPVNYQSYFNETPLPSNFTGATSGLLIFKPEKGLTDKIIRVKTQEDVCDQHVIARYYSMENRRTFYLDDSYNMEYFGIDWYIKKMNCYPKIIHYDGFPKLWMGKISYEYYEDLIYMSRLKFRDKLKVLSYLIKTNYYRIKYETETSL